MASGEAAPSWQRTFDHYHPTSTPSTPPVYSRDFAYANGSAVVVLLNPMRNDRGAVNAATSAKTFAELLSGPTVDIYVGKERRHWSLHRNLLCHHSSYFEAELEGHEVPKQWKNSGQHSLELPDHDPRGFELLVKWLYQGQLEDASLLSDEQKYDYAVACHKLYMLCDKFDMKSLKNLAMNQYRRNLHDAQLVPDADEIDEIYRASPSGSPFRRLMTQIAARQIMDPEIEKNAESYRKCFEGNPDFAVEMVNAIRTMSGGILFEDPTVGDDCEFHDHYDGSYCGKGKGKAKPLVNGTGVYKIRKGYRPQGNEYLQAEGPTPIKTPAALPVELSTARPTPRRPIAADPPRTPTPDKLTARHRRQQQPTIPLSEKRHSANSSEAERPAPPAMPGKATKTPRKLASAAELHNKPAKLTEHPSRPKSQPQELPTVNGHFQTPRKPKPSDPQITKPDLPNGFHQVHRPSLSNVTVSQTSSLASLPNPKAPRQSNAVLHNVDQNPNTTVLGKRRHNVIPNNSPASGRSGGEYKKPSQSVNGVVQHLNGTSSDSGGVAGNDYCPRGQFGDGSVKKAPPKLRKASGGGSSGGERNGVGD